MAEVTKEIVLNEKELLKLLSEKIGFDADKSTIHIDQYKGDQREPSYTSIKIRTTTRETID
jgi:hypothetical protein